MHFPDGTKVVVRRPQSTTWTKNATVLSRQEDGTYTVRIEAPGAAASEVLEGVGVSAITVLITVPGENFTPGPIDARLIGHSKGIKQIPLERGLIMASDKYKAKCGAKEKATRKAAKAEKGIAKGQSVGAWSRARRAA